MVSIDVKNSQIDVKSPYNPDFPTAARKLGGKWGGGVWSFSARDEQRVRDLCREVYGTDGTDTDLVTVRATCDDGEEAGTVGQRHLSCYCCGRQVARAYDRDGGAKLGEDLIVVKGGFGSCGSRKNPAIVVSAGTVIELRDVPRAAVADDGEDGIWTVAIVEEDDRIVVLTSERDRLTARIAEIDAELAKEGD